MPFYIRRSGTWSELPETGSTTRKLYARKSSAWQLANEIWTMAGGVWRKVYTRLPLTPTVNLTVNGSGASTVSVNSSPLTLVSSWTKNADDLNLPSQVTYFTTYSTLGPYNVGANTSHSANLTLSAGQSSNIYASVRVLNGSVQGPAGTSNVITAEWPQPQITGVSQYVSDYDTDTITVTWTVSDAPPTAGYVLSYSFDFGQSYSSVNNPPGTSALSLQFSVAPSYDLVSYQTTSTVSVMVMVQMFNTSTFQVLDTFTQSTAYYIPDGQ